MSIFKRIKYFFFFTKPFRSWLVFISGYLPKRLEERMTYELFPYLDPDVSIYIRLRNEENGG